MTLNAHASLALVLGLIRGLFPASVAGGAQVARLRLARGVERQQIKWFAYAIVVTASGAFIKDIVPVALAAPWLQWVGYVPLVVGAVSIPIAMGVAILRYRLYEIDLLINRTLVYGSLTVLLVALYFGGIIVLQRVFVVLTGSNLPWRSWLPPSSSPPCSTHCVVASSRSSTGASIGGSMMRGRPWKPSRPGSETRRTWRR